MKMMLEVQDKPVKGSVLVFDGKQYVAIKKEVFLNDFYLLENKLKELESKIRTLTGRVLYDEGKITEEDLKNGTF